MGRAVTSQTQSGKPVAKLVKLLWMNVKDIYDAILKAAVYEVAGILKTKL